MVEQNPTNRDGEDDQDLTVVYAAGSAPEASLLVNQLAEAGIRAVVTNTVLEGGAGVDVLGWATLARVAVAKRDAPAARAIALEFDRTVAQRRAGSSEGVSTAEVQPEAAASAAADTAEWPRCPQCHARRVTRCPICSTEGTNFRQADPNYTPTLGVADDATPLSTCGCGSGSCHEKESAEQSSRQDEAADAGPAAQRPTLLCPTCDEPFEPQYARRCPDCGHEFADGFEAGGASDGAHFDGRVLALIALVLAILGVLVTHFALIVPGR